MTFELVCKLENEHRPVKAKSIDFTKDDRFIAIVFASNVTQNHSNPAGLIAIHSFDKEFGTISKDPTSLYIHPDQFQGGEDIRFLKGDSHLLVSDPVHDKILIYRFDLTNGKICKKVSEIANPDARLSFPHGICPSSDGRFLGVSNYGNDNFSIYPLDAALSN